MGLMTRHRGSGIVQHADDHVGGVVDGVDHTGDTGSKEGGVTRKGERDRIGIHMVEALRHRDARAHTQAGVDHVERHGVAEGITADIAAEIRLFSLHRALDRVEGSAVRTACAQDRRAHGRLGSGGKINTALGVVEPQKTADNALGTVGVILTAGGHIAAELAADIDIQVMLADEAEQCLFDIRTELFKAKHFRYAVERTQQEALGRRIRRADLDQAHVGMVFEKLARVGVAHACGDDRLGGAARDGIEATVGERLADLDIALFDHRMILIG